MVPTNPSSGLSKRIRKIPSVASHGVQAVPLHSSLQKIAQHASHVLGIHLALFPTVSSNSFFLESHSHVSMPFAEGADSFGKGEVKLVSQDHPTCKGSVSLNKCPFSNVIPEAAATADGQVVTSGSTVTELSVTKVVQNNKQMDLAKTNANVESEMQSTVIKKEDAVVPNMKTSIGQTELQDETLSKSNVVIPILAIASPIATSQALEGRRCPIPLNVAFIVVWISVTITLLYYGSSRMFSKSTLKAVEERTLSSNVKDTSKHPIKKARSN